MERHASVMDDAALLTCALSGIDQQIQLDESLMSGWHKDDQPMAQQLLDFQHETKRLIQKFVETSPFRTLVRSIN